MKNNNDIVDTYVELKYFPIQYTMEYVDALPDICVEEVYKFIYNSHNSARQPIPLKTRRHTLFNILMQIQQYHHNGLRTVFHEGIIIKLKQSLIKYHEQGN